MNQSVKAALAKEPTNKQTSGTEQAPVTPKQMVRKISSSSVFFNACLSEAVGGHYWGPRQLS